MGKHCVGDELLAAFATGSLIPSEKCRVESHLAHCAACREILAAVVSSVATPSPTTLTLPADPPHPSEAPLREGAEVGRYVIRRLVGAGAMGSVYAAHDPELARPVAIKVLRTSASDRAIDGIMSRMRREAQAMARLSHPNVVTVYDVGSFEGCVFVAMEFVEGTTLRGWLRAASRSWREVLDVFDHAGRGLAAAHAAGLVHRDFKPDNVLVGRDGRVRVTDFGLVRSLDGDDNSPPRSGPSGSLPLDATLTRTGTLIGTPAYMSPEALSGGVVDARSDIFSFCVALYEGLYGERPFSGRSLAELRASIAEGRMAGKARGAPVPAAVSRALCAGLRAEPERRPPSMGALLEALRVAPPQRSRALGLLGATAAVLLGAAGASTWFSQRANRLPTPEVSAGAVTAPTPSESPAFAPALQGTAGDSPAWATAAMGEPATLFANPTAPAATTMTRPRPRAHGPIPSKAPAAVAPPAPSSIAPDAPAPTLRFGNNRAPILP